MTNKEILEALAPVLEEFQKREREDLAEKTMELMDFVSGWCSPHMALKDERPEHR